MTMYSKPKRAALRLEDVLPQIRRIRLTMEGETDDGQRVTVTFPRIDCDPDAPEHGVQMGIDRPPPPREWIEEARSLGARSPSLGVGMPWNMDLHVRGVLHRFGEPGVPAFTVTHQQPGGEAHGDTA